MGIVTLTLFKMSLAQREREKLAPWPLENWVLTPVVLRPRLLRALRLPPVPVQDATNNN